MWHCHREENIMTIGEYADILNVDLIIRRYCNQDNRYMAELENSEIKEGGCLAGIFGIGKTADEAIEDYVKLIKGKRIVFNAMREDRREFDVPKTLVAMST
jgi:hypothetical protein